jgi:hypothetical protein
MKLVSTALILALAAAPVFAQYQHPSIRTSAAKAAVAAAAAQPSGDGGHSALFWSGLGLGIAGVTTAVLGVTVARVESRSSGNAPAKSYQACVAQKADPIYATNNCDALKGKNVSMLVGGVVIGAAGAALMIGSTRTSAEVTPGTVRLLHRIRF